MKQKVKKYWPMALAAAALSYSFLKEPVVRAFQARIDGIKVQAMNDTVGGIIGTIRANGGIKITFKDMKGNPDAIYLVEGREPTKK